MKRRDLLTLGAKGAVGAMGALGGMGLVRSGVTLPSPPLPTGPRGLLASEPGIRRQVRNVIFLAYDGTGYEDFATADFFSREVLGRPLVFRDFLSRARSGTMIPSSLSSWVTDSAAATSAWATGRKVANQALSMTPEGVPLTTIFDLARARGLRTGLVTSARITHATPAGWVAKVPHRDLEEEIALQYLASGTDILFGGGQAPFDPAVRSDGRDLFAEFRGAGYEVVRTADELRGVQGSRCLGLFTPAMQHLPYEVDRRHQGHAAPSLLELTRAALRGLEDAPEGFVLQVEAGRPDHANHQNDAGALIWDWMAADEVLAELMRYVDGRDDTLLLFACDHDTGGGVTYGWGSGYSASDPALLTMGRIRASYEWLLREVLPPNPDPSVLREVLQRELGLELDRVQGLHLASILAGVRVTDMRWGHRNAVDGTVALQMAQLLSMSPSGEPDRPPISFATGNHTAGFVPAALYGAGVLPGSLGVIDNTELFQVMTEALHLT